MRQNQRWLCTGVGSMVLALAASCSTEAAEPASERSAALAAAGCVEHSGFSHCSLGAATLTPSRDGATLAVNGVRSAQKDGVAVVLPAVTSFSPQGAVGGAAGTTFVARSLSAGVATSSFTVLKTNDGYSISAAYTGAGDTSRYNARLYNRGVQVGELSNLSANDRVGIVFPLRRCPPGSTLPWPLCHWFPPNPFRIMADGGCSWEFTSATPGQVTLASGQRVTVDRISFDEIVPASGSYPYLTFDRIDYTSDVGSFQLGAESAQ